LEKWRRARHIRSAFLYSAHLCQDGLVQTAHQAGIQKLYHYEPFNRQFLADTLANSRIHVSNIANVNDPWDCRPWFDKDVSTPSRRQEWATFFRPMLELRTEEQREEIAKMNPPWTDNAPFLARTIDGLIASVVENNIKLWRMYCLTPHSDSILMWSHYSNQHTGICLEFDIAENALAGARKVTYSDDFQIITPELLGNHAALTEVVLLTKSQHWSYETEYRLLLRDRKTDPAFSLTHQDEFLTLPAGTLNGVTVGARCNQATLDTIQTLISDHAPHVKIKRAVCAPNKYNISISQ
jgi:hypothetical protein